MTPFIPIVLGLRPDMTYDEIVEYYRSLGGHFANKKVWKRSDLSNTDPTLYRGSQASCICGGCTVSRRICHCGEDFIAADRQCFTCKRPWWCTR